MMPFTTQLSMALDPVRLFRRATGHAPDAWQATLLRSTAPRVLLNCCRQSGKSTTTASLALHTALYEQHALILLLSPSLRQSQELYRKVSAQYRAIGRPVAAVAETLTQLELVNGSRIVSLPENEATVRGYSGVSLLIIDEAARVDDATYDAVTPMLGVSGGRLLGLSTPWGKLGWWYDRWANGGVRWERYDVPATTPEIAARTDPATLLEAQSRGAWHYGQEYLCQFGERADSVFSFAHIQRAITPALTPLDDVLPMGVY
jgi:Terminase large subunit, T4likevirus-type, N-terminal